MNQEQVLGNQGHGAQAKVPKGTPVRKSWHVPRVHVVTKITECLCKEGMSRFVGLVGASGSGKTTAASEVVRSIKIRKFFSDGVLWLPVDAYAKDRLPSLMLQLARMFYEDIEGKVGGIPDDFGDGAAYIKSRMDKGHGGKGLRCLVVADNVWEPEVVTKLQATGMWILATTRDETLVQDAHNEPIKLVELSHEDAELLMRRAAGLGDDVRLPDAAMEVIKLCGYVPMDVAFVGRWQDLLGRSDSQPWSYVEMKIRHHLEIVRFRNTADTKEKAAKRREAILRAGLEYLEAAADGRRAKQLYLGLAVMPDSYAFTVREAATFVYDWEYCNKDEQAVKGLLDTLERWTILRCLGKEYCMHDAHAAFARERLLVFGDIRQDAVKRWTKFISSLDAVRSIDKYVLKGLWSAVERVRGDGWDKDNCPYVKALETMEDSLPLYRQFVEAVAWFHEIQDDWIGAGKLWGRLLELEKKDLGADHPFVLNTLRSLAICAERRGDEEDAEQFWQQERKALPFVIARMKSHRGCDDEKVQSLKSIASSIANLTPDRSAETETLLREALAIQDYHPGKGDTLDTARTLHQLGRCLRKRRHVDDAEAFLRRGLEIREERLGKDDRRVANILYDLAACIDTKHRQAEAESLWRRCLEIQEDQLGNDHVEVAYTLHQLAVCIDGNGDHEGAVAYLRRALGIEEAKLGKDSVEVAHVLHQLGVCVRECGRRDEATALLQRALEIKKIKLGEDHSQVAYTLQELDACKVV